MLPLNELLVHSLLYGALLSLVLIVIMAISIAVNPAIWAHDYPPDIRARYTETDPRVPGLRRIFAILFFGALLTIPSLALNRLLALGGGLPGFIELFLYLFVMLQVFNLFDLLVLDWLVFVTIRPRMIILPGTEGMAGYRDYGFHFRGFLIGSSGIAVVSLLLATILHLAAMFVPGW